MTAKQPKHEPIEYDESMVENLDYMGEGYQESMLRYSGGFFNEGPRNPAPYRSHDITPGEQE